MRNIKTDITLIIFYDSDAVSCKTPLFFFYYRTETTAPGFCYLIAARFIGLQASNKANSDLIYYVKNTILASECLEDMHFVKKRSV